APGGGVRCRLSYSPQSGGNLPDRYILPRVGSRSPVTDLDVAVGEPAPHDDDQRNPDELGVGELHPGRHAGPVIDDHRLPLVDELRGEAERGLDLRSGARGDDVNIRRSHRRWPAKPTLVVMLLGDRRDEAGDTDAVRPHGHPYRLAVRAERVESERVREPSAELEDVPDLEAASHGEPTAGAARAARRAGIAVADLGRFDGAVGDEVPAGDDMRGVPA